MTKTGFSTSKGFHDDVERVREEAARKTMLCVGYELTDLKLGEEVELDLPDGFTVNDIIGIEFLGRSTSYLLSNFSRGMVSSSEISRWCVGFMSSEGDEAGTLKYGLAAESALVLVKSVGEKFSFEIPIISRCSTVNGSGESWQTAGEYVFGSAGTTRTVYIHFSKEGRQ